MGLLAPNPRKFFEKNLTKNFQAWVQCEHTTFINKKADFRLRKSTTTIHYSLFTLHLKMGVWGKESFFQEVSFPHEKT